MCRADSRSPALVRYACRLADRLRAKWTALYIETPRHQTLSEAARDQILETLRLAEELGAETLTIPGQRIATDLLDYAHTNNTTHIVIGKSERPRWFEILYGSIVHDLIRHAGSISVHVMAAMKKSGAQLKAPISTAPQPQHSS